jgi:glucosamine 6-phosphate synthetase-like amidotransferase/phosphosugar isomerase protein
MHGIAQQTEEWAHTQYFISGPNTRTVLLASRGRSLDRAGEIATEMRFIETPFLVITDDAPERWRVLSPRVLALPSEIREPFSPLLFAAPLSQLGYYLAKARGKQSYNFPSAEREREHYQTLHESTFRDLTVNDAE